jgi:hypothetical protein
MKKYNEKFKKEVKNNKDKENVIWTIFTINMLTESRHSEKQWKSFLKYVSFNLQTIVLLIVHNVFFDVTNSVKIKNSLKMIWNCIQKVNLKHIKK